MKKIIFISLVTSIILLNVGTIFGQTRYPVPKVVEPQYDCQVDPEDISTYEVCCVGENVLADSFHSKSGLTNVLLNYDITNSGVNSVRIGENKFLLCFNSELPIGSIYNPLDIINVNQNKTAELHIYNLSLSAISNTKLNIYSNVKLINLKVSGTASNPINMLGSNISLLNSDIKTTKVAVNMDGVQNILIKNNIISGIEPVPAGSIGIDIKNSSNVLITENKGKIASFERGIRYANSNNIKILDNIYNDITLLKIDGQSNYIIDESTNKKANFVINWDKTGKAIMPDKSSDEEASVWRVAGLDPYFAETGICDPNNTVELYVRGEFSSEFSKIGECPIMTVDEEEFILCKDKVNPTEEELPALLESGECEKFKPTDCIFDCIGLDVSVRRYIDISYTFENDGTYNYSGSKVLDEVKVIPWVIATGQILEAAPPDATSQYSDQGGSDAGGGDLQPLEDDEEGSSVGGADRSGVVVGTNEGGPSVASVGPRVGCSLTRIGQAPKSLIPPTVYILATALILLIMRRKPARAKVKIRKKK